MCSSVAFRPFACRQAGVGGTFRCAAVFSVLLSMKEMFLRGRSDLHLSFRPVLRQTHRRVCTRTQQTSALLWLKSAASTSTGVHVWCTIPRFWQSADLWACFNGWQLPVVAILCSPSYVGNCAQLVQKTKCRQKVGKIKMSLALCVCTCVLSFCVATVHWGNVH